MSDRQARGWSFNAGSRPALAVAAVLSLLGAGTELAVRGRGRLVPAPARRSALDLVTSLR